MPSRFRAVVTAPLTVLLLLAGLLVTAPSAQATGHCYGPRALTPDSGCYISGGSPKPSASVVDTEKAQFYWCQSTWKSSTTAIKSCTLGKVDATRSIAVVGDSHATAWLSAFHKIGLDYGWKIRTYTRGACTPTMADPIPEEADEGRISCAKAMRTVWRLIAGTADIKIVVTAGSQTAKKYAAVPGLSMPRPNIDGFTRLWDSWRGAGKTVVVFPEVPRPGRDVPVCLMNMSAPWCAEDRTRAFSHGTMLTWAARWRMGQPNFRYPLLNDRFCDSGRCYAQVGGVITFRDFSHITNTYSRLMAPYIALKLSSLLRA